MTYSGNHLLAEELMSADDICCGQDICDIWRSVCQAHVPDSILPACSSLLVLQGIAVSMQKTMKIAVKIRCT